MHKLHQILRHKQLHKLIVYGFGQLFNLITPLLVVPYIVGVCGEENFGKVGVGLALSFFLIVFIDYGSDLVGVRDVSINRGNKQELQKILMTNYTSRFLVLAVVLVVITVMFKTIAYFKSEEQLFLWGITILIGHFLSPTWFLQGVENVKWITLSNILSKGIYLCGVFFLINATEDYIYVNLLWGVGMIISNGLFLLLVFKKHRFAFVPVSIQEVSGFLRRDFSMLTSQIFVSLQLNAPVILVSLFGSNLMAGQYKIVEQIILIFKTYILLFFNYVFPKICYLLDQDPKKAFTHWSIYNGANLIFVLLGMGLFYIFSYDIVAYFNTTNRYVLSSLLNIAIIIPVLMAISIPLKQLLLGYNFKQFYTRLTSVLVILNLAVIIILIPYYMVYGVFYTLIGFETATIIIYLLYLRSRISLKQTTA